MTARRDPRSAAARRDRRAFLRGVASAAATAFVGGCAGPAPVARPARRRVGDRLRTAHVGVGGMGGADLSSIASHPRVEVAALCDVDARHLASASAQHPGARGFADWRVLLDGFAREVDAVVVSTPDHVHAPVAMAALERGLPVYCQKPLTHTVAEARALRLAAAARGLPTQMGIQIQSTATYRRAVATIRAGTIGRVSHVHAWSAKNWGRDGTSLGDPAPVPDHLAWDAWLGPAAERPYVPDVYHPGNWRRLVDFGTGTLGDMGVHILDTPYGALALGAPLDVTTTCREPTGLGHPERVRVDSTFPGTAYTTDVLRWTWTDGTDAPPDGADVDPRGELPEDFTLPGQGSLFVGERGLMLLPHIDELQLFPRDAFEDFTPPEVEDGNHWHAWVDACLGGGATTAGFDYAGPLTEALLLGVVAARTPGETLRWDAERLRIPDAPEAEALLTKRYRAGFGLSR